MNGTIYWHCEQKVDRVRGNVLYSFCERGTVDVESGDEKGSGCPAENVSEPAKSRGRASALNGVCPFVSGPHPYSSRSFDCRFRPFSTLTDPPVNGFASPATGFDSSRIDFTAMDCS